MGEGIIKKCPHCGKKYDFLEGIGFYHMDIYFKVPTKDPNSHWQSVIKSKDILRKIDDLYFNYKGKFIDGIDDTEDELNLNHTLPYGYKLYYSESRKMIYSLFDFKIEYEENGIKKIYSPNYEKNKNYDLVPLDDAFDIKIRCRRCNKEFNYWSDQITTIFWD